MTNDDALLRALKELDQPVDPAPAFADRLQRQMHETADIQPTAQHPVTPAPLFVPHEHRRRSRVSTLAGLAAAVLLIAIIGNLWTLTRHSGTPQTATIVAPATPAPELFAAEEPLMPDRTSAANDGQVQGPAPTNGSYERLWKRSISNMGFATLYGDAVYFLSLGDGGPNRVVALDAATGHERWSQPLAEGSSFSLLPQGIVVGTAESNAGPNAFRVSLLSHQTGQPLWTSADVFDVPSENRAPELDFVLAGNLILIVDGDSSVIALDPASGAQRWRYEAGGESGPTCDKCTYRPLVATDTVAYLTDPLGKAVTALSISDGARTWTHELASLNRAASPANESVAGIPMSMIAVDEGVILSGPAGYFGLLSATDGSTVWEWTPDRAVFSAARVQTSLFVSMLNSATSQDPTWQWAEVEIATGAILRRGGSDPNRYSNMVYLPGAGRLIGGYRTGPTGSWMESIPYIGGWFEGDTTDGSVAIDPATLGVSWESSIKHCIIKLPLSPDGKLLCNPAGSNYGEIAVYAPNP
jgi:outer membrane protein assembly factor BamB